MTRTKQKGVLRGAADPVLGMCDLSRALAVRRRYEKQGWQFGIPAESPYGVMVMSDHGNWYHTFSDGCSCPARKVCRHVIAVNDAGGSKALRECLERWP